MVLCYGGIEVVVEVEVEMEVVFQGGGYGPFDVLEGGGGGCLDYV